MYKLPRRSIFSDPGLLAQVSCTFLRIDGPLAESCDRFATAERCARINIIRKSLKEERTYACIH
jgi:hypothetical protein